MRHTDREYERELHNLRERLLYMGSRVIGMIDAGLDAFSDGHRALAEGLSGQDKEIDQLELEIDEACLRILAKRQPVASDLRFLTTVLKLVTDLERVGDLAVNLGERVLELKGEVNLSPRSTILQMGSDAQGMLKDALTALEEKDAALAADVLLRDDVVDATYARIFPELLQLMMSDRTKVTAAQNLQSIAKYIERMADHATNVAEMVVFMVRGDDLRHPQVRMA